MVSLNYRCHVEIPRAIKLLFLSSADKPQQDRGLASLLSPVKKNNSVREAIVPRRCLIMNCLSFLPLSNKACQNKLCLSTTDRFGPWQITKELSSRKLGFYWHNVPPAIPMFNHSPILFFPVVCELASPAVKSVAKIPNSK